MYKHKYYGYYLLVLYRSLKLLQKAFTWQLFSSDVTELGQTEHVLLYFLHSFKSNCSQSTCVLCPHPVSIKLISINIIIFFIFYINVLICCRHEIFGEFGVIVYWSHVYKFVLWQYCGVLKILVPNVNQRH